MLKAEKNWATDMVGYASYMLVCSIRKMFFVSLISWVSPFLEAVFVFLSGRVVETVGEGMKVRCLVSYQPKSCQILSSKPILHCPACNPGTFSPCHLVQCETSSVEGAGGTLEGERVLPDSSAPFSCLCNAEQPAVVGISLWAELQC